MSDFVQKSHKIMPKVGYFFKEEIAFYKVG